MPPQFQSGGVGSAVTAPAWSGAEPQPKSNLMHFRLKTWHLATILLIFLKMKWPHLVKFCIQLEVLGII